MNRNTEKLIELSRTKKILAISSKTEDKKHILIWDFDNIPLFDMLKSLSKTQKYNGLGCIYIFKSNNGYNAVCLDKFFIEHAYNIKYYTRWADFNHTKIGWKQGNWAWRVSKDKEFLSVLKPTNKWDNRTQSKAHKLFLEQQFNLKINIGIFDIYSDVIIESYTQDVM